MKYLTKYLINLLISIDQLGNTLIGGDPDETISSRVGKSNAKWAVGLSWVLNKIDTNHTTKSREDDEGADAVYNVNNSSHRGPWLGKNGTGKYRWWK